MGCNIFKKWGDVHHWPPSGRLSERPNVGRSDKFVPLCSKFVCVSPKNCKPNVDCDCYDTGKRECFKSGDTHTCPFTPCVNSRDKLLQLQDDQMRSLNGAPGAPVAPVAKDGTLGPSCVLKLSTEATSYSWMQEHSQAVQEAIRKDLAMSLSEAQEAIIIESVRMPRQGPTSWGALTVRFHSNAAADEDGFAHCDKVRQVLGRGDLRFGALSLAISHAVQPATAGVLREIPRKTAVQSVQESDSGNVQKSMESFWK